MTGKDIELARLDGEYEFSTGRFVPSGLGDDQFVIQTEGRRRGNAM